MPSAKKVTWAQLRVGVMAIVAMVILGVLIFLLTGQRGLFSRDASIYAYLGDSAALGTGAPVRLNGILIGQVEEVGLSGSKDPGRVVRVRMVVEESRLRQIPVDSVASISAENVLGTKYINIEMGRAAQTVKPGGEIRAQDTREFQELVESAFPLLQSVQSILGRVDTIVSQVEKGRGSVGKLLVDEELYNRLNATVREFQQIAQAVGAGKGTVGKLLLDETLYNRTTLAVENVNSILRSIQTGQGTAGKLINDPSLYTETRATVAEMRKLMDGINAGQGTAGKLLKDEALYRQMSQLIARLDTTIAQINAGQGTLGQLAVNPQLYESLQGLTAETRSLIADIRANPSKFLRIRLGLF